MTLFDARQVLFVGQRVPRNPFCSLVLPGAVVGAPGADNLKIRPEFSSGGVGCLDSMIAVEQKCFQAYINGFISVIFAAG
ncbi:hypothetical protein [Photobacterium sp. TLY01]|uniref:hypothetical protein n=1 Tax=Photobacterium sp. TLY01 TaxID=2907534 RepID=UPI001F2D7CE0|nr:hypothetical protein [Photobacterium sp. TLY01]UIP30419.1 hypothetical protein LN341_17025 [Photobacterium sp. TLY01]